MFESIPLQRRVVRTPVRTSKAGGSGGATTRAQNAAVQVSSLRPTVAAHLGIDILVNNVGGGDGLARALPTALMTLAARLDELPSEVVLDRLASP